MARHKWVPEDNGQRCAQCRVFRSLYLPVMGSGIQMIYEWQDGPVETRPRDHTVPPCPGAPESKL